MPEAIASPPAAPAAPAAPASAPSPEPKPSPAAAPAAPSGGADPIRDFDKALTDAFDKAAPLAKKSDEPVKPAEPAKPAEPVKAAEPPKQVAPVKVPKELRAELDRVTGELGTKSKQITEMEAKIKEYEAKGKDTSTLTERLGTLEKQLEDIQAENRALKQETSPEFKQKYEVPFQRAADRAKRFIETLDVSDPETNSSRKGTLEDLVELTRLYAQAPNKAMAKAEQLFGTANSLVMPHVSKLNDLEDEAKQALQEEKATWKQKTEAEESRRIAQNEQLGKAYEQVKKELGDSVDDYHDDPTDKELVSARDEGFKLFDQKPATLDQRVIRNAHIRHRFAAFGPMKLKAMRLAKELAEAKAELETYKNEPPDPSRRRGGKESGKSELSWEEDARRSLT